MPHQLRRFSFGLQPRSSVAAVDASLPPSFLAAEHRLVYFLHRLVSSLLRLDSQLPAAKDIPIACALILRVESILVYNSRKKDASSLVVAAHWDRGSPFSF